MYDVAMDVLRLVLSDNSEIWGVVTAGGHAFIATGIVAMPGEKFVICGKDPQTEELYMVDREHFSDMVMPVPLIQRVEGVSHQIHRGIGDQVIEIDKHVSLPIPELTRWGYRALEELRNLASHNGDMVVLEGWQDMHAFEEAEIDVQVQVEQRQVIDPVQQHVVMEPWPGCTPTGEC